MKKNLVLIGMMGSGKSTIGKIISTKSDLKLKDTDNLIEKNENMKIKDIFERKGENFFRTVEEKIVLKALQIPGYVIAVGGGSFLNEKIRTKIKKNGISFWLNWRENLIIDRIKNNKKRPLIKSLDEKELRKLMNLRSKIYLKADYKINCDNLNKFQNHIQNSIILY